MNEIESTINYLKIFSNELMAGIPNNKVKEVRLFKKNVAVAIQVLEEKQERENPQPLTLKNLKQRIGHVVWLHNVGDNDEYVKIIGIDDFTIDYLMFGSKEEYACMTMNYGKTYCVYDHEPKCK